MFWQTSEIKDIENITYDNHNPLTTSDTKIIFSYGDLTCEVAITVNELIVTPPTKVNYRWNEAFNTTGMSVTLGGVAVTGYTMTLNGVALKNGDILTHVDNDNPQTVTVAYNGMVGAFNITIKKAQIDASAITFKNNVTYTGSEIDVFNTNYWNNLNTSYFTVRGNKQTNHSNEDYQMELTPDANHEWTDGTSIAKSFAWNIKRKNITVSLNPATVAISASNYSAGINVAVSGNSGNGAVSLNPASITGLTLSVNGNTINVKGNGSTAVSEKNVTVTVAQTQNYNSGTATLKVSATYWSWGSETGTADATWWSGLKSWIATASTSELSACVGKTKSVTLTTAVLGTTTHLVRCIGYNCNRDKNAPTRNTLTFETANTLATATVFGTSNGKWTGSTVRQQCINYYNAFPGKASVATVSIGTATTTNSSQNGTPTYTDETVFLASDAEHGFPAGHDYNSGKGYSASYNEFDKQNTSKTPYQYCTSNANRIKKQGDNGSAYYYWERSLRYDDEDRACYVYYDGKPYNYTYRSSFGLAPAFVI